MQHLFQKSFKSYLNDTYDKDLLYQIYPQKFDNTNPKYLKSDNKYISNLIVIDYSREMQGVFLDKITSLDIDLQMAIYYERQMPNDIIKKITYNIGNVGSELKTVGENQTDVEMIATAYSDAKYIRKQMQVYGEELYYLYMYISVYADSKEMLEKDIQKIENIASGIGLKTRRALFRQTEIFNSTLPLMKNENSVKKYYKRNVLNSGATATYPFVSNELCDENGVLIGINDSNKSLVMIDRFDSNKYKNSNMCIIGTSGSGKSYFSKLMLIRNRYLNIKQFVIDPEGEYVKLCNKLKGSVINFDGGNVLNLMDIRENSEEGCGYLQAKINRLNTFFSMIFPDLNQKERNLLEEKIIETYKLKGITFDDESLYCITYENRFITNKRFKSSFEMPILQDLYGLLKNDRRTTEIANLLMPYVDGSMRFLNGYTNINCNNQLVVADIHNVEENTLAAIMFVITELFWDKIKRYKSQKKILYLDEVWRLIDSNEETANFVFKMFKTIRKYGGAATAITQDINDFFCLENGKYGKGILNNSSTKAIFQLEENEMILLAESINLSEEEKYKIQCAKRGDCLLYAGNNHVYINIKSSEKEHKYISTDRSDNV